MNWGPIIQAVAMGIAMVVVVSLSGCSPLGNPKASDPFERGCSYIAAAIVVAAMLRALFNK